MKLIGTRVTYTSMELRTPIKQFMDIGQILAQLPTMSTFQRVKF